MHEILENSVGVLNYCAMFVAAISGAAAGIKARVDIFGVAVIAFVTACSGGILRDLLLGDLPPENIRSVWPLAMALTGGAVTAIFFRYLQWFLNNPVQVFDAFGLGLFTVIGSVKALAMSITPVWAVLLGVVTGIGGGMVRDILLGRAPNVLHREIYATASIAGGVIVVGGHHLQWLSLDWLMLLGAGACITLRCLSLRYNWHIRAVPYNQSRDRSSNASRRQ